MQCYTIAEKQAQSVFDCACFYFSLITSHIIARTRLQGVQVVMTYYQGAGVTSVQFREQFLECRLLLRRARVGGLSADVQAALIADAYRVGVVVLAVGADHILRTTRLDLSVTTDNVVVAYAEVETPLAMPGVDLRGRARLVRPHRRTMYYNQCYRSHLNS